MKNKFYVIMEDNGKFVHYDILPYLSQVWGDLKPKGKKEALMDLQKWVDHELRYQFWSRCQYEILLSRWPSEDGTKKVDIYWQAQPNLQVITKLFKENEGIS